MDLLNAEVYMKKEDKIYVAGHRGLVGSSIVRELKKKGYENLILKTHAELDLERQTDVEDFFKKDKPEFVFLAAAKVGGIMSNKTYPAEFIYNNLLIQVNIIHSAYKFGVKKLLFLGSSCIYPRLAPQPMREEYLLTSPLEPTNEAYALAKIAGLKMCRYYNEQYGTNFISVQPTNLYGPNDRYDLFNSHVLPALIRKFYLAKLIAENRYKEIIDDFRKQPMEGFPMEGEKSEINRFLEKFGIYNSPPSVKLWGTGSPKREFLYIDDLAEAVVFLMERYNYKDIGELINIGTGEDISIKKLAEIIKEIVGFKGKLEWDSSKPDGTPRKLLDVSNINKLGWRAKTSLEDGIKLTYEDYLKLNF
jgi:GDP-L-fucose synthase